MWLDHELNGYPDAADVPSYRQMRHLPIRVTFAGLGGLSDSKHLGQMDLPKALRLGQRNLRQSVAERTSLAVGETGMDDGGLGMPDSGRAGQRQHYRDGQSTEERGEQAFGLEEEP